MLSLKRDVVHLILLYLLPEGRRLKRWCAGWDVSAIIFLAFLIILVEWSDSRLGRLHPMILDARRTTPSSLVLSCDVV